MDDIVERLRNRRGTITSLCDDAADEIERLRADVKRWRDWAVDYACDDAKCECDRCDAVMQAYTGCTCRSEPNACPEHHDPTKD